MPIIWTVKRMKKVFVSTVCCISFFAGLPVWRSWCVCPCGVKYELPYLFLYTLPF
jgi:hypothetical protein